ncbi:hypothetical protein SZN_20232 [Streptomyces zinciresistens K42]|uniref:DUF3105 domain-containing protein n=2 Tax=Streptomyces TaxID=1883 RepID=G2GEW3_9ACTN|nr:hypothetical protein SZN_20232 [Streptomyces zinciresistens K42]
MRRAEAARERRSRIITWTLSGAIVAGVIGGSWWFVQDAQNKKEAKQAAAAAPVKGEKTFKVPERNHVTTPVDYKMSPAAGGNHNPAWMNCNGDVYAKQVNETNAVHSLEHGAVWVTYTDKATEKDVNTLKERVKATPYTMISPFAEQSSAVALSAWGKQLNVDSASDPRVQKFLDKYVQGRQTPEPGAACTGGLPA